MIKKIFLLSCLLVVSLGTPQAAERQWRVYKDNHFIIYYDQAPLDFVKTVEDSAEDYYTEIARNMGFTRYKGWTWDDRAAIYIYNDPEDYVQTGKQAGWSHGVASPKDRVIRTFPTAHGFFDSTLPHELGHIIFREFVGFDVELPRWFEEGVAMYQEKARRFGSDRVVKQALDDQTFMTLPELEKFRLYKDTDPKLVELFYAESASVINYMINDLGEYRFVNFCRQLKTKRNFDAALKAAYVRFNSVEELNKAWMRYLK